MLHARYLCVLVFFVVLVALAGLVVWLTVVVVVVLSGYCCGSWTAGASGSAAQGHTSPTSQARLAPQVCIPLVLLPPWFHPSLAHPERLL